MNGRSCPADDIASLPARGGGLEGYGIGEELDRARETVQRQRAALRLAPGQPPAMTPLRVRRMARSLP
jgi:hypothetical protein